MNFRFWETRSLPTTQPTPNDDNNFPLGGLNLLTLLKDNFSSLHLSAVFAAVELISNSIASLPIVVKELVDNKKNIVKEHPVTFAFKNSLLSHFCIIKNAIKDMLMFGNGFILINRADDGTVLSFEYLKSQDVTIRYKKHDKVIYYMVSGYKEPVESINMLHFYKNSDDGVNGTGILSYAINTLKLYGFAEKAAQEYFASGCSINGILTVQSTLTEKQKQEIRTNWAATHGTNNGGLAVLPGNMKYQQIGSSGKDAQLLETRLFEVQEVARYFNINPTLLGDLSKSSYNTLEQSMLAFLTQTLMPIIVLIEEELNRKLITTSNNQIDIDETYLLRGDKASTASYIKTLVGAGILSINEARAILGYNGIENGDSHFVAYTDITQNTIEKDGKNKEDNKDDSDVN